MKQVNDFSDERSNGWCVFCGGPEESRDHVPSRVMLDKPYPTNLPVVPARRECNASFSKDEAYVASLVECALVGSVDAAGHRHKIRRLLDEFPGLSSRLSDAQTESDGQTEFSAETNRVRNVVLKLARGHVAFELNEPQLDEPVSVAFTPLTSMSEQQRASFEARPDEFGVLAEIGSRAFHRVLLGHDLDQGGWIGVQPGRYRYRVAYGNHLAVQFVIGEYLAAEVVWA